MTSFLIQSLFLMLTHFHISSVLSTTFTITNKCGYTVWPGILSNADAPSLSTTGFSLQHGETKTISAPASWGGRIWGRTHCTQDSTGKFSCLSGDCGSGKLECSGSGATPPATLAEFKLDGYGGLDYFDVSLVDGYNLPVLVGPQGGRGGQNCTSTGCLVDLNGACPADLKVTNTAGESVACKSACEAFREDKYCCNGAYATPDTCKPSYYSQIFKSACPHAYSYAYDDKTSTFTCASADYYVMTFCPSPNSNSKTNPSQKSSQGQTPDTKNARPETNTGTALPQIDNSTMVYEGAMDLSGSWPSTSTSEAKLQAITTTVSITLFISSLF